MPKEEIKATVREKKSVLAIDDDLTILTLIRKILEKDYDICLAKSAVSAMNILNNTAVDLILLDMEMPSMSGLDFLHRLREDSNHYYFNIPVIFVTSHGTKDILVKAAKSGVNDFIVKPVNPKILHQKIASLLLASRRELSMRDSLLKQLHLMTIACRSGNNSQVEKVVGELKKVKYNFGTDSLIADICQKALCFDYPAAAKLVSSLLKHSLYDLIKDEEHDPSALGGNV